MNHYDMTTSEIRGAGDWLVDLQKERDIKEGKVCYMCEDKEADSKRYKGVCKICERVNRLEWEESRK